MKGDQLSSRFCFASWGLHLAHAVVQGRMIPGGAVVLAGDSSRGPPARSYFSALQHFGAELRCQPLSEAA
eukprot:9337630-Karenia_brevis.AAC.1